MDIKVEMKEKLLAMKLDLENRLSRIKDHRSRGMDGAQNEDDMSQVEQGEEVIDSLEKHEINTLNKVTAALNRIEKDSYGICIVCDDDIREKRIRALPYTLMCEECAEESEIKR